MNGGEANAAVNTNVSAENTAELKNAEINNPDLKGTENSNTEGVKESEETFENLISGKYKADFENAVNARLSEKDNNISELSERLSKYDNMLEALAVKYDKKSSDIDGILKAVSSDDSYFEESAAREGVTVEQYKNLLKFDRMQEQQREAEKAAQARTQAQNDLRNWFKQGEALKETYPQFDFQTEIANKDFLGLLKNGISVEHAYKVMHSDELINGAAKTAAENAEKNAVIKMQQKANRPVENGVKSAAGALINTDISKLTREQRAELARRAARGEKITF